eukprot:gnl/TRDRNA2_/TRDRNA2_166071_c0_seq1.p1 gnl/TRDRNA2_/TRDRNA2_166071_c0~~gnl/TRDRNA2_/TRDRNA2_166071_c0_seq1.p1  ORF type:complete len:318 (+),score=61.78 gnl/TRDRNA2_/TRDRNA2_166071_c0_seq1:104-955(+)
MYSVVPYFLSKVVAEAPVSAGISMLGGTALYPLVGFNRAPGKLRNFLSTMVLEGFASSGLGLMLGAVAPSTDAALALFPPILVVMVVFNGFNIAEDNVPKALRWIPKVSFIRWCSEGLAVNEFTGLTFECDRPGPCCKTGEEALERVSFGKSTVRGAALAQTRLIGVFYLATLYMLQRNKPKFLSIQPPPSIDELSGRRLHEADEQLANIQSAFSAMDTDKSGALDSAELKEAMEITGHETSTEDVQQIIATVDRDGDGQIDAGENLKMAKETTKPEVAVVSV